MGVVRAVARVLLGAALVFAGVSHLTFARTAFYAQIPPWLPLNAEFVIAASGVVEIVLGLALVVLPRWRVPLGWLTAALFVVVFPGNVSQYLTHSDAFGLDSDRSRAIRLAFQPLHGEGVRRGHQSLGVPGYLGIGQCPADS